MSTSPTSQFLRNENLIPEGVPVIFLERPWTVLKLSFKENIPITQKLKLLARAIVVLFRFIVTWELTMHAGIFVKEEGKIYRYHMTGTKAIKQDVPKHYLHGCHWLIPNDKVILKSATANGIFLEMPKKTNEEDLNYIYSKVGNFVSEACDMGCSYSNAELLSMPFYRHRSTTEKNYIEEYMKHKPLDRMAKKYPTFICTEFVATAWARAGIQIADSRIRIEKIFMWNIQRYSTKHNLFTLHKA